MAQQLSAGLQQKKVNLAVIQTAATAAHFLQLSVNPAAIASHSLMNPFSVMIAVAEPVAAPGASGGSLSKDKSAGRD